jgi:hypothetical protein
MGFMVVSCNKQKDEEKTKLESEIQIESKFFNNNIVEAGRYGFFVTVELKKCSHIKPYFSGIFIHLSPAS